MERALGGLNQKQAFSWQNDNSYMTAPSQTLGQILAQDSTDLKDSDELGENDQENYHTLDEAQKVQKIVAINK